MREKAGKFVSGLHFQFLTLVVLIAGAVLGAQLVYDTVGQLREARQQRLEAAMQVTNTLARSLENRFETLLPEEIERILASISLRDNIATLSVVDLASGVVLDSDPDTAPKALGDLPESVTWALETHRTVRNINERIEVVEPLVQRGSGNEGVRSVGAVMVDFHNPTLAETLGPILKSKLYSIVPILLVGLLFAAKAVSQIVAPIRGLSETARQISAGNLECEAKTEGAEEIKQLAHSFNQMVGTIRRNISQIYDLAYVDKVTRLPNREFFRRELTQAVNKAERSGTSGALLFVDLDGFKRVNDTFGHDLGDELLAKFADRITKLVRNSDRVSFDAAREIHASEELSKDGDGAEEKIVNNTFARLGGDEFTILLPDVREETDAGTVARRIIEAVNEPFVIDGKDIQVGTSIGIATFPREGRDYQTILKHADMAMYQAKEEGKNTFRFFSRELNEKASQRMEIETDLRQALDNDELGLFYQPKIDIETSELHSLEALVRWHHPEKGMVNPGEFISIAEDCGLILPLGEHIIRTACRQIAAFEQSGRPIPISVNISVQQFERPEFADTVRSILDETGANPALIELEITESMAMNHPEKAIQHIETLKKLGVRFAIDDFGTGYSNLAQLSRLPFDVFKIDRSFVMAMDGDDSNSKSIVRTIIAMAHSLNYETVAEGVETVAQEKALRASGCTVMQGFLYAKPMALDALEEWLETGLKAVQDKSVSAKRKMSRKVA